MDWLQQTFQKYPELAIFLALAVGFFIGKIKLGKFSLGSVTGVLLIGLVVGQMDIAISPNVKSVFFLMFLFAIGYSVGPQFFQALKKDGIPQMIYAAIMCVVSLMTVWLLALLMKYNAGQAAGLLAGSQTTSAVLGVASGGIGQLQISDAEKQALLDAMPVCFAVTYIFGTAGSAWLLSSIGPKLLGGLDRVREQCKELEKQMGGNASENPTSRSAYITTIFRAYKLSANSIAAGKTVKELEDEMLADKRRVFVERIRNAKGISDATAATVLQEGDEIVISGRGNMVLNAGTFGTEIADSELLDFPVETVSIYITNKKVSGMTLSQLIKEDYTHGVLLQNITREGIKLPLLANLTINKGDVFQVLGLKKNVDQAAANLGYVIVSTEKTDMVFLGLGIVLGGLLGTLTIYAGGVPISIGTSGGTLFAGLVFGWLRSKNPMFGNIPEPALWVFNNVGLNTFIAVVGITSGPSFVVGIKEVGPILFVVGIAATCIPLLVGILMGRYVFKFHPALTLGCAAGARATTAALAAIQDSVQSKLPALGYTVTYAVGSILLTIWGIVIVLLMT
ncbi:MAG TPA: aspartate-alanine antiporter [Mucilaginibacter sp.]|jgi:putative transport protein